MGLIVLVTGSRDWTDEHAIRFNLDTLLSEHTHLAVITGGADGADTIVETWCESKVSCLNIPPAVHKFVFKADPPAVHKFVFKADWKANGKAAGPIRNRQMIAKALKLQEETGIDITVLAFPLPESIGTYDMINACKEAGIHGKIIRPKEAEEGA